MRSRYGSSAGDGLASDRPDRAEVRSPSPGRSPGPSTAEAAEGPLLDVRDLHTEVFQRRGRIRAVDGVSFTVGPGETVGLVGESGCGKTMTGMSVMRLLPPGARVVSGSIRLAGRELTTLPERDLRRVRGEEVAMVFQDPMTSLNPCMTIGDQIAEPVRAKWGASKREASDRAAELLDLVGVPMAAKRLRDYPHQLSGGLRQRVMIAIAISCNPKLLIADEPTTALDVTIQAQVLALLDDLKERLGMGMLLITHDLGVIAGRADRILVMYSGQIVEEADTEGLFFGTRHPYSEALLNSLPRLDGDPGSALRSIPGLPPDLAHPPPGCRFQPRCAHATARCAVESPELLGDEPGHRYACFNPVGDPGPIDPLPVRIGSRSNGEAAARRAPTPLLSVEHVVKEYPVTSGVLQRRLGTLQAVSDVSFKVFEGETFGLVGESGCGKTTLGRMVTALERPDSGTITFDGRDLRALRGAALRRHRRNFQLMFQDPYASLDPRMRVGPAVREPLAIHREGTAREQRERVARLLVEVGLERRAAELFPHEFSGGQRQRIGFARALTLEPRLIVADEPVSALDVSIRSQILNLMKRVQATRGLSYIVISHDLSVVRHLADRVGVMYLGKLVEEGPSSDVYAHPAHPYTKGLLDAIPVADPVRERAKGRPAVTGELPSALAPPSGCRFRTRCPRAQGICAEQEPALEPHGSAGHRAACHFPL